MLAAKFHVRSVLTKINSSNFFENKNMSLVEDVLAFALPGYCQNIIIDSYSEEESLINSVIKIGGTFNREVRVSRCTNSLLTTGQCIDILEDTSYES
jgi:exosome complex RNA-binding protein Rrp42 (RNase PH superfamily)